MRFSYFIEFEEFLVKVLMKIKGFNFKLALIQGYTKLERGRKKLVVLKGLQLFPSQSFNFGCTYPKQTS